HFAESAALFRAVLRIEPENGNVMNLLGYAEAYAGNLEAARKAIEDYGRNEAQKTNALDSLGEVHFLHGRFTDAEKYFLQANESNRAFLGGTELLKAAYAHWLAGDLKGADAIAGRYFDVRKNDRLVAWREASWLYSTGRREQAIAKLKTL